MIELLAAADSHWTWVLLGRLHPLTVHFPIALLLVAAVIEAWGVWRRKIAAGPAVWTCVWMGTLGAGAATLMGYAWADQTRPSPDLELHERLGLVTCVMAAVSTGLAGWARKKQGVGGPAMVFRGFLFLSALGVSLTGHYGGELVHGPFFEGVWDKKAPPPPLQQKAPDPAPVPVADTVDFVKDIAPIIKASCLKCHSPAPNKIKGKLRLDTKELAMKGGSGGKCIVPGKPADSTFYTLLVSTDPDERMPEKADPLPKEQTELVRKWIEQGALWPDGVEIK